MNDTGQLVAAERIYLFLDMPKYNIGDIITLEATGDFAPGIDIIVVELDENGVVQKARAAIPDPRLARHGFIEENGEYYAVVWRWSEN